MSFVLKSQKKGRESKDNEADAQCLALHQGFFSVVLKRIA